jgi:hypothetical protein
VVGYGVAVGGARLGALTAWPDSIAGWKELFA